MLQTTYYSEASGTYSLSVLAGWNSDRDGVSGSTPTNFTTSGDIFVIQGTGGGAGAPHSVIHATTAVTFGAGVTLTVEGGATLQANIGITINATGFFNLNDGATYINNTTAAYANLLAGTENFHANSNFEIRITSTTGPGTPTNGYGNLYYANQAATTMNSAGLIQDASSSSGKAIKGNFRINTTGIFRLTGTPNLAITIGGDFRLEAGTLTPTNGTANAVINLEGDFSFTGGTILHIGTVTINNPNIVTFNFTKAGIQNFTKTTGSTTISSSTATPRQFNFYVKSGSILNMGTNILDALDGNSVGFTVEAGGGVLLGDPGGIVAAGTNNTIAAAGTGNIKTSAASIRSFSTGGNYTYNGSAAQVTGTGLPTTVNNFTVNNSSATGVSLTSNLTVSSTLTLTDGNIILGTNNLVLDGTTAISGAPSLGSAANSFVVTDNSGTFTINNVGTDRTGDVLFPIGYTNSTYSPVAVNYSGANVNYTASVNNTPISGAPSGECVQHTWTVNPSAGTPSTQLKMQWAASAEGGSFVRANSQVAHYNGSILDAYSAATAASGSNPYFVSSGATSFTGFGPFGVTSVSLIASDVELSGISTIAASNIAQGDNEVVLYNFKLVVTTSNATLTQVTFPTSGTYTSGDFYNFKLWHATVNNIALASTIGTISSPAFNATQTFASLSQLITAGTTGHFWITADVSSVATVGNTIEVNAPLSFSNLTFGGSINPTTGSISAGGTQTIIAGTPTVDLSRISIVSAADLAASSTNNIIYNFKLAVTGVSAELNQVNFPTAGTYASGDFANLKLWYHSSNDFSLATTIATITSPTGAASQSFTSLTQTITYGNTGYFWITADVTATPTNLNTLQVTPQLSFSDLTFSGSINSTTGTISAGGLQRVLTAADVTINEISTIAAGNIAQATTNNVLYNFSFTVAGTSATLTQVSIPNTGTYTSGDFNNIRLYYNTTNNGPGSGASIISTITSPGFNATQTFASLSQTLNAGSTYYFWITGDVAGGAVVGNTITVTPALAASNFTFGATVNFITGTINAGGTQTISAGTSNILLNEISTISASNINAGSINNVLYNFRLSVTTVGATLTQVDIPNTGTYTGTDFTNFKLWYNTSNSFATASTIATISAPANASVQTFNGFSQTIPLSITGWFWVTADVEVGASPNNITVTPALSFSELTFAGGYNPSVGTINAGGTKTILSQPTVTLSSISTITAGNIAQATTDNIIYNFQLDVINNDATLSQVTIPNSGSYTGTDLNNFKIWYNSANDFSTATLKQTLAAPGFANPQVFNSVSQLITAGTTGYFWITANVAGGATIGRDITVTPALAFSNLTFSTSINSVVGSIVAGGTQTVSAGTSNITLAEISAVTASDINNGTTNNVLYNFSLAVSSVAAQLNEVRIPNTGTYDANDFTNLKLLYNASNNFGTAATIGTITAPGNTSPQTFTGLTQNISIGGTGYFWVTADVEPLATPANTITVTPALAFSNLTFAGAVNPTVGTISAGGTKTIADVTLTSDYFQSITDGNWGSATTWRSSHDGLTWLSPATISPTSAANTITVRSGDTVTVAANVTVDQVTIATGGNVTISPTFTYTIANGTGTDLVVDGYLKNSGVIAQTGTITVSANATYEHNINGGLIPTASWNTASTCLVTGFTNATSLTAAGLNQSFGNFVWNCTSQTTGVNFVGNLRDDVWGTAVKGDFTIVSTSSGSLRFNNTTTTTLTIGGKFEIQNGAFILNSGAPPTPGYNLNVTGDFNILNGTYTGTSSSASFYNLSIGGNMNVSGGSVSLSPNSSTVNVDVTGNIDVSGGTLIGVGNGTSVVVINVDNDFIVRTEGLFNPNSNTGANNVTVNIGRDFLISSTNPSANTKGVIGSSSGGHTINVTRDFLISGTGTYKTSSANSTSKTYILKIGGNFSITGSGASFVYANTSNTTGSVTFSGAATGYSGGRTNATIYIDPASTFTPSAGSPTFYGFVFDVSSSQIANKKVTLLSNVSMTRNVNIFTVSNGATLDASTFSLTGAGGVSLASGSKLITANADGIRGAGGTPTTGSIQTTGTNTYNSGTSVEYNSSSTTQNSGLANITLSTAGTIANITINNTHTTPTVNLGANTVLTGTLAFTSGKLLLGNFNLTASTITGVPTFGSTTGNGYVVTNGTGLLTIASVGASNTLFPVGASVTNYNPVQLNNSGTVRDFAVNVNGTNLPGGGGSFSTKNTWTVTPSGAGANVVMDLQWNISDEDTYFDRTACSVTQTDGTTIINTQAFGNATGSGPYTRSFSGITAFDTYWGVASFATPIVTLEDVTPGGQVPAQNIGVNSSNNILYSFRIDAAGLSSTVNSVSLPNTGSYASGDFDNLKLYYTTTSTFAATTLLQTITSPGNSSPKVFNGFTQAITGGTSGYFWITGDVASGATAGNTFTAGTAILFSNIGFTTSYTNNGENATAAGTQTIAVISPSVAISANLPTGGYVANGTADHNIYGIRLMSTGANTTYTSITVNTGGTYVSADVANYKLWTSAVSTFSTGTSTLLGTIASASSGGALVYNSFAAQNLITNTPVYLYITVDVDANAIALNTINIASTSHANIVLSSGTKTGTNPVTVGNTFTFIPWAANDFGSLATGNWGTTNANWRQWDGTGWNITPGTAPSLNDNVFILAGHVVSLEASAKTCKNLTVLGNLTSSSLVNALRYLRVYGTSIKVIGAGFIGDPLNQTGDNAAGIGITNYGGNNLTISGNGTGVFISRLLIENTSGGSITIDRNVTLTYHGSTNQGGHTSAFHPTVSNTSLTVNAGKTLTFAPWAILATTSSTSGYPVLNTSFVINGTLDVQATPVPNAQTVQQNGRSIYLGTNGGTVNFTVGSTGVVNAQNFYPNGTLGNPSLGIYDGVPTGSITNVSVDAGGVLNVYESIDFANPSQTITGAGTFNLLAGANIRIGSPDGVTTSPTAAGPIRTTTRNFANGTGYMYQGTAAQVTGNAVPATINKLWIRNTAASPNAVTLTNNPTVVTDSIAVVTGILNIPDGYTLRSTSTAATRYLSVVTGATLNVYGTLDNSSTNNVFTKTGTIRVYDNGTYIHNTNNVEIPAMTWDAPGGSTPGATCLITGIVNATPFTGSLNQAYQNFTWDCAGQTSDISLAGNLRTVVQNLNIVNTTNPVGPTRYVLNLAPLATGNYGNLNVSGVGAKAADFDITNLGNNQTLNFNNVSILASNALSAAGANSVIVNLTGNWNNSGAFTPGFTDVRFIGSAATQQYTQTGTGSFYNLRVSNTAAVSPGLNMNNNLTSTALLTLTTGVVTINSNTLTINNVFNSAGTITGSASSNLTVNGAAGTVRYTSNVGLLRNLLLNTNATLTISASDKLDIAAGTGASPGSVTVASGATLTTNDKLTLLSDANGTSRVGISAGTITGKVVVERYMLIGTFPSNRRWHLMTAPFLNNVNAQTINQAWQEGANSGTRATPSNPNPGYGTLISRSNANTIATDGYDQGNTTNSSIYFINPGGTPSYGIPATTNGVRITDHEGYMLFVRGDRSIIIGNQFVPAKATNIRASGNLRIGSVSKNVVNGTNVIGNPYASAITMDEVEFNGTSFNDGGHTFYYWDPKTSGNYNVGKFIAISNDGIGTPSYTTVDANVSGLNDGTIQSGVAVVMLNTGSATTIDFTENDKLTTSSNVGIASRPGRNSGRPAGIADLSKLYTNMFAKQPDGSYMLADGVANTFYPTYSNAVTEQDALKLSSFNTKEDLSLTRDGKNLAIEKRKPVVLTDTAFLTIKNLDSKEYQFSFKAQNFNPEINAFLEDTYAGTMLPINTFNETYTTYNFTIDNNSTASSNPNRFRIVFRKVGGSVLPVRFTDVKAAQQNNQIAVEWKTENQTNVKEYQVEKSTDGINFTNVNTTAAVGATATYNWLDVNPASGVNYYRIRSVSATGEISYSTIVKVQLSAGPSGIVAIPSVITDGNVGIQFNNMAAGRYNIRLINTIGQIVLMKQLNHGGGNAVHTFSIDKTSVKGIYQLEVIHPDNKRTQFKIVNQ